tara:strand:+ start:228 stop:650 length:423 start_codon:yes stop_codon:yes gene_type:complete
MIKYNLKCYNNHEFSSWFSDSKEFEKLKARKLLECIFCSSKNIEKSIMAPMITNTKSREKDINLFKKDLYHEKNELLKLRNYVENNFEFVGDEFSKKVREIFYDKKSNKRIYGTTSPEEREELLEEGIDLLSIPWVNKDN